MEAERSAQVISQIEQEGYVYKLPQNPKDQASEVTLRSTYHTWVLRGCVQSRFRSSVGLEWSPRFSIPNVLSGDAEADSPHTICEQAHFRGSWKNGLAKLITQVEADQQTTTAQKGSSKILSTHPDTKIQALTVGMAESNHTSCCLYMFVRPSNSEHFSQLLVLEKKLTLYLKYFSLGWLAGTFPHLIYS